MYTFDENHPVAVEIADSPDLALAIYSLLDFWHDSVVADLTAAPNQMEFIYTWDYVNDAFAYTDPGGLFNPQADLFRAFGRVQVVLSIEVAIIRTVADPSVAIVDNVKIEGVQSDLYDWDYMIANWDLSAMKVQASFPTLFNGTRGKIYKTRVELNNFTISGIGYTFDE